MQPIIEHIPYFDANHIAMSLCQQAWAFFLDSADRTHKHARFSIIGLDPFEHILAQKTEQCPFSILQNLLIRYSSAILPLLSAQDTPFPPGFQGGIVGYLGYECGFTEPIDNKHQTIAPLPKWAFACYDVLIVFDHHTQESWIVSTGHPETDIAKQKQRAEKRLLWLKSQYLNAMHNQKITPKPVKNEAAKSNFNKHAYMAMVKKAQEAISEGDCFEINVAQAFQAKRKIGDNMAIYQQLRHFNPAPFSAFMQFPHDLAIASSSPEQFLQCHHQHVVSSPIKGSIIKSIDPEEDKHYQQQLLNSKKDLAENVMIVDLLRNDLSQVCRDDSVQVSKLCQLETFTTLHHLVSCIEGSLLPQYNAADLLQACFPGGSISGAPKIQAMKKIAALELAQRGPYCGSLFHLGFNGTLDSNLLIRTLCLDKEKITYHAGGAVTLNSDPEAEWHESILKSQALTQAIGAT